MIKASQTPAEKIVLSKLMKNRAARIVSLATVVETQSALSILPPLSVYASPFSISFTLFFHHRIDRHFQPGCCGTVGMNHNGSAQQAGFDIGIQRHNEPVFPRFIRSAGRFGPERAGGFYFCDGQFFFAFGNRYLFCLFTALTNRTKAQSFGRNGKLSVDLDGEQERKCV